MPEPCACGMLVVADRVVTNGSCRSGANTCTCKGAFLTQK